MNNFIIKRCVMLAIAYFVLSFSCSLYLVAMETVKCISCKQSPEGGNVFISEDFYRSFYGMDESYVIDSKYKISLPSGEMLKICLMCFINRVVETISDIDIVNPMFVKMHYRERNFTFEYKDFFKQDNFTVEKACKKIIDKYFCQIRKIRNDFFKESNNKSLSILLSYNYLLGEEQQTICKNTIICLSSFCCLCCFVAPCLYDTI